MVSAGIVGAKATGLGVWRTVRERTFVIACMFATLFALCALVVLFCGIVRDGWGALSWDFITSFPSRRAAKAGIYSALVGTLWLMGLTTVVTVPLGVGAAVYLEEFAPKNRLTAFIQLNISNLAGVPSIVYGLLGLTIFVRGLQLERSLAAGALTLSLLILPVVITAAQEALRAVPRAYREASLAIGATTWETVRDHVLPQAVPSIITGIILGLSRAIGETAPLITIGAFTFVTFLPSGPLDKFTALPIQIFDWASRPQAAFHELAAGGILVLMAVLLLFNSLAIGLRLYAERKMIRL